jgi:hypothetical protein
MAQAAARYREYAPCEALRGHVRALFICTAPAEEDAPARRVTREIVFTSGQPFSAPLFADARVSIAFSFGAGYRVEGLWHARESRSSGHVIGPVTTARQASHGDRIVQIGAYLRTAQAHPFTRVPGSELTNRIAALNDLWGVDGPRVETMLYEARDDATRLCRLEAALLERIRAERARQTAVDLRGLSIWIVSRRGGLSVSELACAAGVSRQHLNRAVPGGSWRDSEALLPSDAFSCRAEQCGRRESELG